MDTVLRVRKHALPVPWIVVIMLGSLALFAVASYALYLLATGRPPFGAYDRDTAAWQDARVRLQGASSGDVDCSVSWSLSTPCEGDCWAAYETYTGTVVQEPQGNGAPCPPLTMSVSCAGSMPCLCMGSDLPLSPAQSLTTCNDCDYLQPGDTCYLQCAAPHLQMMGVPELTCANGTWAYTGLPPSCNPVAATCPPVLNLAVGACDDNGIIVQPGSVCVGARDGDVCNVSCMAGFSIPMGSVSSAVCLDGRWTDPRTGDPTHLVCAKEAHCVAASPDSKGGVGDTCAASLCPGSSQGGSGSGAAGSGAAGAGSVARRGGGGGVRGGVFGTLAHGALLHA